VTRLQNAVTNDGVELPVIDVTNPAFAVAATEVELEAMSTQYILASSQINEMPAALRQALQTSTLGKAIMAASGTFLPGLITYLLKLGPENLGAFASAIDRQIAASFPAFAARLRLQDIARLLADGLLCSLLAQPRRPLCLINVGGGVASDSWNALIHLQAEISTLADRAIVIAVIDIDDDGPAFGARAMHALRAPAAPLDGLDVSFRHFKYDWSAADRLRQTFTDLNTAEALCAISSEGGLFEYGSDTEIMANLNAMHAGTGSDAIIVGSVTRDCEVVRVSQIANRVSTRPRTMEAFRSLVEQGGWVLSRVIERPFSYNVSLVKR
jgi:hypothetical protein